MNSMSSNQWTGQFLAANQMPDQFHIDNATWMPPQYTWQWNNEGYSYFANAPLPQQQQQQHYSHPQQQLYYICQCCLQQMQNLEIAKDANAWRQNQENASYVYGNQNGQQQPAEMLALAQDNFEAGMEPANAEGQGHVKRPMNAFMLWSREERKKILLSNPKMHNAIISKILGEEWNKMANNEKKKYYLWAKKTAHQHRLMHPDYKFKPNRKNKKDEWQQPGMQMAEQQEDVQ